MILRFLEIRVSQYQKLCSFLYLMEHLCISQLCKFQRRKTMLHTAEEIPRTTKLQIGFGDLKTICCTAEEFQAFSGFFSSVFRDENTITLQAASADTSPELMELRQAETFSIFAAPAMISPLGIAPFLARKDILDLLQPSFCAASWLTGAIFLCLQHSA